MNDLKPCPFCGQTNIEVYRGFRGIWFFHCHSCEAVCSFNLDPQTREQCVKSYNERKPVP